MNVDTTAAAALDTPADSVAIGVFDGDEAAHPGLQALLDSGEARRSHGAVALAHDGDRRLLLAGLGARDDFDEERARVSAAIVAARASELGARHLCWRLPDGCDTTLAGALVEGTMLASYRFDRYRERPREGEGPRPPLDALTISASDEIGGAVARAKIIAGAVNDARTLQDTPGNDLTPGDLADHAAALGEEIPRLTVSVERREESRHAVWAPSRRSRRGRSRFRR